MRALIASTECEQCRKDRKARFRVGQNAARPETEEDRLAYSKAPALFNFNVPRYFTMLLRAREFAKAHHVQIAWTYALDTPLHPEDRDLSQEKLEAKRLQWLRRHDQDTANLTSVLPLAVGMPVRLTDTLDRNLQLYRHRRGTVTAGPCTQTVSPKLCHGTVPRRLVVGTNACSNLSCFSTQLGPSETFQWVFTR